MIRREFPNVTLIINDDNKLFSKANNQGANVAKGKYLLLLNSDTIVEADNLQRMIDFFETQASNVICIGPKVLNKDGTLQSNGMPEWGNRFQHFCKLFNLNRILPLHLVSQPLDRNPNRTHRTGWVLGACMMVRRDLYDKVGGLNENLIFYGEEPEFGYRTKKLGYKTIYFSGASIIHLGGASTIKEKSDFNKSVRQYERIVKETIGVKEAILICRITRLSFRIKRLVHPNKQLFDKLIENESKIIEYFKDKINEQ